MYDFVHEWTTSVPLAAGVPVAVRLEFVQLTGRALSQLSWESPSRRLEPVSGGFCGWLDSTLIPAGVRGEPPPEPWLALLGGSPARASEALEFSVPVSGSAEVEVLDVTGRRVESAFHGVLAGGATRRAAFGGPGTPSGVYFARLRWPGGERVRRFVLFR